MSDAKVKAFIGSLAPQNAEAAKADIATVTRLAPVADPKAYVLGIFRANAETSLGNREAAADVFTAALKENPFITGVWKDLGDALDTGYDAVDTWRCYELARIIALITSSSPTSRAVKRRWRRKHPEFF